eukprot:1156841-Alexandrium_andersonii.AAC.1
MQGCCRIQHEMKVWQAKGNMTSMDLTAAAVHLVLPCPDSSAAPGGDLCLAVPTAMAEPPSPGFPGPPISSSTYAHPWSGYRSWAQLPDPTQGWQTPDDDEESLAANLVLRAGKKPAPAAVTPPYVSPLYPAA